MKRFRKSLNVSPLVFGSMPGADPVVVLDAGSPLWTQRTRLRPSLQYRPPVHLGEAHLQHHLLRLAASGHLQQIDDLRLGSDAVAISPTRNITFVLDTLPDRIVAPVAVSDRDIFAGYSMWSCCRDC